MLVSCQNSISDINGSSINSYHNDSSTISISESNQKDSNNTDLPNKKSAIFDDNKQIELISSKDNYEDFFKTNYKQFYEVEADNGVITFSLDNQYKNFDFKVYYSVNTPIYHSITAHTKTTIDDSNDRIVIRSSFDKVLTSNRMRTMFLYSFSDEQETLYLSIYSGSSYVDNNAINELIISQANIKSISIERKDSPTAVNGEMIIPTTTLNKDDENTIAGCHAIFDDYELLNANDNRTTTPGYSTYKIQIENTSNEVIEFFYYDGFLSYKGNAYVLESHNKIVTFLRNFFANN